MGFCDGFLSAVLYHQYCLYDTKRQAFYRFRFLYFAFQYLFVFRSGIVYARTTRAGPVQGFVLRGDGGFPFGGHLVPVPEENGGQEYSLSAGRHHAFFCFAYRAVAITWSLYHAFLGHGMRVAILALSEIRN